MDRGLLYYAMVPLLLVAALLQATAANRLVIGSVKPDLVLILLVVGALLYGPRVALVWAFLGGLMLDIFSGGPLGSSSIALMAATVVAGLGHRTFSRFNLLVPLTAMALGTLVYGVTYIGLLQMLNAAIAAFGWEAIRHQLPLTTTVQAVVVPSVAYNTTLMLLLIPLLNRIPETPESTPAF